MAPSLDHTIRWTQGEIPSVLALLAELTGINEKKLKQLSGADTDRVLVAFSILVPIQIKEDFQNGKRPLATPAEVMTEEQRYSEIADDNDPENPLFPRIDGPMVRYKEKPQAPAPAPPPEPERAGMDVNPPEAMRRVG